MNHFSFLFSPTAQALGHTILYSFWQAFIVFICLRVILKLIPDASARFKYSISYSAYLGIAAWFVITLVQQLSLVENEYAYREIIGKSVLQQISFDQTVHNISRGLSLSFLNNYLPWIVGFYLLGIVCFGVRLMLNYFQTNQLKTKGLTALDMEWQKRILQLAGKMNIRKTVRTYFSHRVETPLMIGFFKPMILLPLATVNHLSVPQFEAVLLHELAHIRRDDYFFNLLQSVIDIILFFNPFTWWITKNIREEREKCCDEMVLQLSDPYHYASALLALEEPVRNSTLLLTAVGKHRQLFYRIKNIIEMKNNRINLQQKFISLLVIATAVISVAWLTPKENKTSHSDKQMQALKNSFLIANSGSPVFNNNITLRAFSDSPPKVPPHAPLPPVVPVSPMPPVPPEPTEPPLTANGDMVSPPPVVPSPPLPPHNAIQDTLSPLNSFLNSPEWKKQQEELSKSTAPMQKYFQSNAWKKQQEMILKNAAAMQKYFNSPEWKKQQDKIQKNADHVQEYFNSPEWKKQQEELSKSTAPMQKYFQSNVWKKQREMLLKNAAAMQKYFNSPEWKKQQDEIQKNALMSRNILIEEWKKQQEEIKHSADSLKAYFNSDAWKKQQEALQKTMAQTKQFFESDEWKKQQQEFKKMIEENKEMMKTNSESKNK